MKTIKELVLSVKNGNKKAFDKLYKLTSNDVWFTCVSLLKDEENAKDIMQETYITAFLKLDTLKDEEKFCGWLTAIATNKSKNKLKGKVEYQIDDEVLIAKTETDELMLPEEYINKAEKRKVLLQIIEDTLSFNQYQVVLMFYFNELSIAEIAQALEISEGTVKSRLNSSRAKMKTAIEDYENITQRAAAQWTVIDPSNLVQNIKSAVQSSTTASNMIKSLQESVKIYNQSKAYYDALKSVHNIIKDARKVKLTIEMVSEITDIYMSGFNRMVTDRNFTSGELAAISAGYARLLEEGGALVAELKNIVTSGNGLSLSDKERMDAVDQIYTRMLRYRNLTRYYTDKAISVSFLRSQSKGDAARVQALYGKPSERYW